MDTVFGVIKTRLPESPLVFQILASPGISFNNPALSELFIIALYIDRLARTCASLVLSATLLSLDLMPWTTSTCYGRSVMGLWTEFEGVTVDRTFALTKLVQTEGRSAFFGTHNVNGEPVLIRIIECHFDEDEILARWRGVQSLGHPNFLHIDHFGQFQIEPDDITAVYAVFQHVDANLGEVLERGHLSAADAVEIGLSVVWALETLHANGFVHEHVEAGNVYAVSERVKLRSDCIRETPEGEAGVEARRRDVHGLAMLLMEVLVGKNCGAWAARQALLPAPFDEIVRNGMTGIWGLAEIKTALAQCDLPKAARRRVARQEPVLAKPVPPAIREVFPTASPTTEDASTDLFYDSPAEPAVHSARSASSAADPAEALNVPRHRSGPMEVPMIFGISEHDFKKWRNAAALVLAVLLAGWILVHHWLGHHADADTQPVFAEPAASSPSAAAQRPANSSLAAPEAASHSKVWRVVAFTYNRKDQAQKKASTLASEHPDLSPAAFSPNGKAPWLVTIGGSLQHDEAYALARKARSLGLPRDTYAQNYTVATR